MTHKDKEYCLFCFGIYRGLFPDSSLGPGVWSSYFLAPKTPGSNPPGTSPTQDPGGPRKPPSLWRTKREELSLGTQAWGDITAGERKLRQLDQLCCLSSFPAPCLPKGPARVGHEFPSLEPRYSLVESMAKKRLETQTFIHTLCTQRCTQVYADTGMPTTQRPPSDTPRNVGSGGRSHNHICTKAVAGENHPAQQLV